MKRPGHVDRLRPDKRGLADEPGEAARWTRLLRSVSGGNGFWVFLRQEWDMAHFSRFYQYC